MSERGPEQPRGKFASPRDEALYILSLEGWACESCGSSDGPFGWNAWMSNAQPEIPDLLEVLDDVVQQVGLSHPTELVGNWLLHENNEGFVDVASFETEDELRAAYDQIEAQIDAWESQEG